MEILNTVWQSTVEFLISTWNSLADFFSLLIGRDLEFTKSFILFILAFVICLLIFWLIAKKLSKKKQWLIKKITLWYDKIFYLLAKYQYTDELDKSTIWGSPFLAAILPIISWENPDYIKEQKKIKENIRKIWIIFKDEIISEQDRDKMNKLEKEYNLQKSLIMINRILFLICILALAFFIFFY